MTYQPGIPLPSTDMSESQQDLLDNFTQLNTQFGNDHVAFDETSNNGKHNKATMLEQATPATNPSLVPAENELIMYAAEDNDMNTELYIRQHGKTASQFTKDGSVFVGAVPAAAVNFTPLGAVGACTMQSNYNVFGVNQDHASKGQFTLTFGPPAGASPLPDANYYWTIDAMRTTEGIAVGAPRAAGGYGTSVTAASLLIDYYNSSGGLIDSSKLVRCTVIVWRMQ